MEKGKQNSNSERIGLLSALEESETAVDNGVHRIMRLQKERGQIKQERVIKIFCMVMVAIQ